MIRWERRNRLGWHASLLSVGLALALTLVLTFLALWLTTGQPFAAFWQMLTFPWQAERALTQWGKALNPAFYLSLIALGLSIAYRANVWNIGAEGQFALGAIVGFGAWLGMGMPQSSWALPIILLAGAAGGMAWAAIPAALRTLANTNELLVSLMLVYVGAQFLFYLSNGPWEMAAALKPVPTQTESLPAALQFSAIFAQGPKLHWGLLWGWAVYALVALVLGLTLLGYRLAVANHSARAERFAGFSPQGTIWIAFLGSGGLAGLAGAIFLTGDTGYLVDQSNFLQNYGFTAIIVAFLGRLHPLGIVLAGLTLGYLEGGAGWLQASGLGDDSISGLIQAIALFCTLGTAILGTHRPRWEARAWT